MGWGGTLLSPREPPCTPGLVGAEEGSRGAHPVLEDAGGGRAGAQAARPNPTLSGWPSVPLSRCLNHSPEPTLPYTDAGRSRAPARCLSGTREEQASPAILSVRLARGAVRFILGSNR